MAAAYFGVLLLPSLSPHYGFYSDELYYLACTDRLALGYVDQPPFFVWVLRLHREIFGSSLIGLRVLPAASGALAVFLTGWMAGRMGGGRFAQVLGSLAMMASINSLTIFSFFTVNCLAILLWTLASWVLLELCRSREPRLWIVLGAPYIEWLRGNRKLSAALSAITAAVVGVILNLTVWFALHVVFANVQETRGALDTRLLIPDLATVDLAALVISTSAFVAMLRFKVGMLPVLGVSAAAGMVVRLMM